MRTKIRKVTKEKPDHLRKLKQSYIKEQKEKKKNHLAQQSPWLLNNTSAMMENRLTIITTRKIKPCCLKNEFYLIFFHLMKRSIKNFFIHTFVFIFMSSFTKFRGDFMFWTMLPMPIP